MAYRKDVLSIELLPPRNSGSFSVGSGSSSSSWVNGQTSVIGTYAIREFMRIKCVSKPSIGPVGGYIIGSEYRVIEMDVGVTRTSFRIEVPVGQSPYLVDPKFFEITSRCIPSRWIINTYDKLGVFTLTPSSWACDGFWDAYFDGEAWAERLYEQELSCMKEEDPLSSDQRSPDKIALYVLDKIKDYISQDTVNIVRELIAYKETAIALDILCTQISQQRIKFHRELKLSLIDAAHLLHIPLSQLDGLSN